MSVRDMPCRIPPPGVSEPHCRQRSYTMAIKSTAACKVYIGVYYSSSSSGSSSCAMLTLLNQNFCAPIYICVCVCMYAPEVNRDDDNERLFGIEIKHIQQAILQARSEPHHERV